MKIIQPKEVMRFEDQIVESNLAIVSVEVHDNESSQSKNRETE